MKFTIQMSLDEIDGRESLVVRALVHDQGLDRPQVTAWGLNPSKTALAKRLAKAVEAGAVLVPVGVKKDVYGKTYLDHRCRVRGRCLNADLKRLGF